LDPSAYLNLVHSHEVAVHARLGIITSKTRYVNETTTQIGLCSTRRTSEGACLAVMYVTSLTSSHLRTSADLNSKPTSSGACDLWGTNNKQTRASFPISLHPPCYHPAYWNMDSRRRGTQPPVAPSAALAHMLGRLDAYTAQWEHALVEHDAKADYDDAEENAIRRGVKAVLPQIADAARAAADLLEPADLSTFAEAAAELENRVVERAYSGDESEGFDFVPLSCGEVVRDEAMGKTGGLGHSTPTDASNIVD
jgi:hypothetical protein